MYKKKKIEPLIGDVLGYTSPEQYAMYMGGSKKTFYRSKTNGKIVTIYVPVYSKGEFARYKRVYIPKEELKKLLDD